MREEAIKMMNDYNAKPEVENIERTINLIEEKGFIPMDILSLVEMDNHEGYLNKLDTLSNLKNEIQVAEELNDNLHTQMKDYVINFFETIEKTVESDEKGKPIEFDDSLAEDSYNKLKSKLYKNLSIIKGVKNEEHYVTRQKEIINRQNEVREEIRKLQDDNSRTYEEKKPEMMRLIGIMKGANASALAIATKLAEATRLDNVNQNKKVDININVIDETLLILKTITAKALQMDLSLGTKKNIFEIDERLNGFKQNYTNNLPTLESQKNKKTKYQQLLSELNLSENNVKMKAATLAGDTEVEEKARLEDEAKLAKEAEEKARLEDEARLAKEAKEKARLEEEARLAKEAEEKSRLEEETELAKEAEEKARLEDEAKLAKEAEEKAEQNNEKPVINGKAKFKALGETIHRGKGTRFIKRFSNVGLIASGVGIAINPPIALFAIVGFTTYKKYANWRDSVDVKTLPSRWSKIKSFVQYSVSKKAITPAEKAEVEEILENAESELEVKPKEDVLDEAVKSTAAQLAEEGLIGPQFAMENEFSQPELDIEEIKEEGKGFGR